MLTRTDPANLIPADDGRPKAVVIGAGLGGLATAMRLGAKGFAVTVLERLDRPGGRGAAIHLDGHRFDLGPTIVTVPQLLRSLWRDCGRDFDEDVDLRPMDPFYEIRWPDGSAFRASGTEGAMEREIARLSPDDLPGFARFLDDSERRYAFGFETLGRKAMSDFWAFLKVLPTFGLLRADRSVYGHAARRFRDERLRMAFSFHPLLIGGDPFHVTSIYTLVSHLERAFGVHYAMGGVAAIARAMAEAVEDQGGLIRYGAEVDEIVVENGAAAGVRLAGGETIPAPIVVSNADAGHTYDRLLRRRKKRRWTAGRLRRSRWSMGLVVWHFGTRGTRGLWPDVGHHTILCGADYRGEVADVFLRGRLAEDLSLYVHRPTVTDPGAAPEGDDTFYALSPVPHLGHDAPIDWAREAERHRLRIEETLERCLLPGLRARVTASMLFTPETFRDRYLSPHGAGFSLEPRILQSGWFRPHNVSEEARGLYLVGAGTHPGAGLPGVVASAEVVADLIEAAGVR